MVLMENEVFLVIQHTKVLKEKHDIIGTKIFQPNGHNTVLYNQIIHIMIFFSI